MSDERHAYYYVLARIEVIHTSPRIDCNARSRCMLAIVHSGQTGVERGAHRAAVAAGLPVSGFMPPNQRDELGQIPTDIAQLLTPCVDDGPRQAASANVTLVSGLVLLVPDSSIPDRFTAMAALLRRARSAQVKSLVCDPRTRRRDIVRWAQHLRDADGSIRIMVTGPRGTRWEDGEAIGHRVVFALGRAPSLL